LLIETSPWQLVSPRISLMLLLKVSGVAVEDGGLPRNASFHMA
jgi:hypothetical protein